MDAKLSSDVESAMASLEPARVQLTAGNSPVFARVVQMTEKMVQDEFALAAGCRIEVGCNTQGVCEVKLVCDL